MGKLWHRDYYDNIIRDEKSYQNIVNYIINNPKKWKEDKFYVD
jgi:REP element-mobilizing transposase RayT